ncbi:MAG: SMI1/KNR4 family protein [Labilithrix sp.]|nr:SMI1/KNR4 family protein [Labilithrix sp.]
MREALRAQLERCFRICRDLGSPLTKLAGASEEEISETEAKTGIRFSADLRSLYQFSNGGRYEETWFVVMTDQVSPYRFCPLAEVCEVHGWFAESSYDAEWDNGGEPWDPRIRKYDHHTKRLPFADFGNGSGVVYFDADPSEMGRAGQIITYQHDPDAVRFFADDLVDFLAKSNELLEREGPTFL